MKTIIQIEKKTANKLKKIRLTKRESYDEIINRILTQLKIFKNDSKNN